MRISAGEDGGTRWQHRLIFALSIVVLAQAVALFVLVRDDETPERAGEPREENGSSGPPVTEEPGPTTTTEPPGGTLDLQTWAVENEAGSHHWSRAEAIRAAQEHDLITALPGSYDGHIESMKAANEDLLVLAYVNAAFSPRSEPNAYPPSWYARDSAGNKITSEGYGNFLMNPRHEGWIAERISTCRRLIRTEGFDGCMLDLLTDAPLVSGYASAEPIDPLTGRVWTRGDWLRDVGALADRLRSELEPIHVVGNALSNGNRYFRPGSPTSGSLDVLDGAIAEGWLRHAGDPPDQFRSVEEWKADLDMLVDAERQGTPVLVLTKIWTPATPEQRDRVHEYALASFLLVDNGTHYFSFSGRRGEDTTEGHPWWDLDIGEPTGPHVRDGEVFRRTFHRGEVLVNPTDSGVTVPLRRPMRTLSGSWVTEANLGPNEGRVLLADTAQSLPNGSKDPSTQIESADGHS